MIEKTYQKYITDHGDAQMRRALFDVDAPEGRNVIPLAAVTRWAGASKCRWNCRTGCRPEMAYELAEQGTRDENLALR